jgi:zona occludens toxin
MAINAYTGLMGSGKSYEVVENVTLPALSEGRRVVTNVAGLNQEEIAAYIQETKGVGRDKQGVIVQVSTDDLLLPNFFPREVKEGQVRPDSVLLPGDLLIVDECWRLWPSGSKVPAAHMEFFRMHRHFADPATNVTCDIALIVQDIGDLARPLKVVVENTYVMRKKKLFGSSSKYQVFVYQSYRTSKKPLSRFDRKYNKQIFPLYQSYSQSGGIGKEVPIDERGNIFKSWTFRVGVPAGVVLMIFLLVGLYKFFHRYDKPKQPAVGQVSGAKPNTPSMPAPAKSPVKADEGLSDRWRLSGFYYYGDRPAFVLVDSTGRHRYVYNPKAAMMSGGLSNDVRLPDGSFATPYSGSQSSQSSIAPSLPPSHVQPVGVR